MVVGEGWSDVGVCEVVESEVLVCEAAVVDSEVVACTCVDVLDTDVVCDDVVVEVSWDVDVMLDDGGFVTEATLVVDIAEVGEG